MNNKIDKDKFDRILFERCHSVASLAKETGVSPTTLYDMRNGKRVPRPTTLKQVTEALGVNVRDILTDGEEGC